MPSILKTTVRYILLIFVICVGMITIIASGDGDYGDTGDGDNYNNNQIGSAPIISNLSYSLGLSSLPNETGKGAQTIRGHLDYIDDDGNLADIVINVFDSNNNQVSHSDYFSISLPPVSGLTSETYDFTLQAETIASNLTYTFEIYAIDDTDLKSNILTGAYDNPFAVFISGLFYTPKFISVGSGEGTIHVWGEFDIDRYLGNTTNLTYYIEFFNPNGDQIYSVIYDPEGSNPSVIYTSWEYDLDTSSAGNYTFKIHLIDTVTPFPGEDDTFDLDSNVLEGEFVVYSGVNESAPVISDLSYSPISVIIGSDEGMTEVVASVTYYNNDDYITQIHYSYYDSDNKLKGWGWLPVSLGISSEGEADFSLLFNTSVAENYTFKVYAIDESDNASNVLIGEFNVTE